MDWEVFKQFTNLELKRQSLALDYEICNKLIKKAQRKKILCDLEIGVESKNEFDVMKLLLLNLQIKKKNMNFLQEVLDVIGIDEVYFKKIKKIFKCLFKFKNALSSNKFNFGLEFFIKKVKKVKIYFPKPKLEYFSILSCLNIPLLKIKPFFRYIFSKNVISVFAVECEEKNREFSKLYLEFYLNDNTSSRLFSEIIKEIDFEYQIKKRVDALLVKLLKNKDTFKICLRFKEENLNNKKAKIYWGLKPYSVRQLPSYLDNFFKKKESWKKKVNEIIKKNYYISYIALSNDGVEIYWR